MITSAILILSMSWGPASTLPKPLPMWSAAQVASFEKLSSEAERARAENRDDDAIQLYQRALALSPAWKEGQWYLGALLYGKSSYLKSQEVLRRFVAQNPNAGPGWALLGMSEFETHEYSRALEHLRRAMALGMGDREGMKQSVFYNVAVLYARLERYDDSMNMLLRMIASNPDQAPLIEPAGLAALRMPMLPAEIPPDRIDLIRMAGRAAVATESGEDAEAKFKQLEAAYPNEPGVHFLYGAYLMPIRPKDGLQEMNRELEISPHHVLARVRIAEHYLQEQEPDAALPVAQEAVKLDPKLASAHMVLGEAQIAKGQLADGIKELEIARDGDPATLKIHWDLLRAYTRMQRNDDAKREKTEIEKLIQADARNPKQPSE